MVQSPSFRTPALMAALIALLSPTGGQARSIFQRVTLLDIPHGTAPRRARSLSKSHRSDAHTSALQSLMRISYAVFCLKKKPPLSEQQTSDNTKHTHI